MFNKSHDLKTSYRLTRLRLRMENNIPFKEIDEMSLEDFGDIVGYLAENAKADEKLANRERGLKGPTGKPK